jgi:radical SAM protein with 4Fe4S-binding SPASM domain
MLAKHGLNWDHLYLLQVRNEEWTASQVAEFANFIEFLYDWVWEKENHDKQKVISRILDNNCFNILSSALIKCGRGLTCGIQSQLTIRVSDLMVYPCHRLGYEDFYCGQWVADEEKILRYENRNIELMMGISTIHKESLPMCTDCPINELCIGPCLGAQYESNGNMFAPIPSVCALTHALIVATIKSLKKMGIFNDILACVMPGIRRQLEYIEKEVFVNAK